jgi:Cu/Ag efflux pump CusA
LREAVIDTPSGARMPLGDVATLEMAPTPNEIKRENASLRIDVTLNVAGSNLGRMAREVQERVQALKFEPSYHPEFLGQYAMRQTARDHLGWLAAASLLGTIVLLHHYCPDIYVNKSNWLAIWLSSDSGAIPATN